MSALDPSAPGLPLAGGVGGGASLPTTPALALLDAGNPNVLVGLDADGVGVAVPPSASGATVLTGDATAGREALGAAATLPISAQGDLVIGDAMGAPSRFAKGTDGKFLKSSATSLMWDDPPSPLPTTLAGALLDVPNADRIVVLDEFGVGAAVTGAQLSAVLAATRRGALSIPLLWECNEPSGPALNTGTLGAAGNLSTIGSGVTRAALASSSVLGKGTRFNGTSNGYIRGATGVGTGSTSALSLFAVATIESEPGGRRGIITRAYTTSYTSAPWLSCGLVVAPGGSFLVEIARPGYTELTASIPYVRHREHLFGLTYDGTTLRAWLDGAPAGSITVAGAIDWGAGDGDWWLASNPGNEASASLITRAGAAAAVWGQDEWAELWQRTNGCWVG